MLDLPASVFWKDIRGVYLGCNDVMADLAALTTRQAVIGIDDNELVGEEAARQFVDNDREVIESGKPQVVDEFYRNNRGILIKGFSTKAPLFDGNGSLVGLYGISFLEEVTEDDQLKSRKLPSDIQNQYTELLTQTNRVAASYHSTKLPAIEKLSAREAQCLQMIAKGLTAKAIADKLDLSKRTVETYIESVKSKLGCHNKTELIVAAIKHKYIDVDSF